MEFAAFLKLVGDAGFVEGGKYDHIGRDHKRNAHPRTHIDTIIATQVQIANFAPAIILDPKKHPEKSAPEEIRDKVEEAKNEPSISCSELKPGIVHKLEALSPKTQAMFNYIVRVPKPIPPDVGNTGSYLAVMANSFLNKSAKENYIHIRHAFDAKVQVEKERETGKNYDVYYDVSRATNKTGAVAATDIGEFTRQAGKSPDISRNT